jgi:hypothetical protein
MAIFLAGSGRRMPKIRAVHCTAMSARTTNALRRTLKQGYDAG